MLGAINRFCQMCWLALSERKRERLNKTFALARLLATWTQHIGLTQNVVDCSRTAGDD